MNTVTKGLVVVTLLGAWAIGSANTCVVVPTGEGSSIVHCSGETTKNCQEVGNVVVCN